MESMNDNDRSLTFIEPADLDSIEVINFQELSGLGLR